MSSWIPAIASSTLLAVALWLARNLIITRLTKSVEHEFNSQLENLRAQLRQTEEQLKSELRARESEIDSLRNGALSAMASRQMALDKRRIEAVEQIWSAALSLGQLKTLVSALSIINYDLTSEKARSDPRLRAFLEEFGKNFDVKKLDLAGAGRSRPFVSPPAWATYVALTSLVFHALMKWQLLKSGVPADNLVNDDVVNSVIKAALPENAAFIEKHGVRAHYLLIDKLEEKLLRELSATLNGADADKEAVDRAAEIVRLANEARAQERVAGY